MESSIDKKFDTILNMDVTNDELKRQSCYNQITEKIYVGNAIISARLDLLKELKVTHILACGKYLA